MSWDNAGGAAGSWDGAAASGDNSWVEQPAATSGDNFSGGDAFTGIDAEHVSKHEGAGGSGYTCRNCNVLGHFSKDCTEPGGGAAPGGGGLTGECFNCGQVGHNKSDCTNERVEREFTGTCRICEQPGHRGKDCPSAPPKVCKRCLKEGHVSADCDGTYKALWSDEVKVLNPEQAWTELGKADQGGDLDDFKIAFYAYCKAAPDMTLDLLQEAMQQTNLRTWLIARQQEVSPTHTIVNIQGQADQEFVVSFQYGLAPRRAKTADSWPKTVEENLERLKRAGFVRDRMVPLCHNCNELGHISKNCPEDKREIENKTTIVCQNCKAEGHYLRDCPTPRVDRNACRNCGESGHNSKECDVPRNPATVECRVCSEMGHFSKDCPSKPKQSCFNCDSEDHRANDCPEPRKKIDWSKITCKTCGETGHGPKRCPLGENGGNGNQGGGFDNGTEPAADADVTGGGEENGGWETGGGGVNLNTTGGDDSWNQTTSTTHTGGW